MGQLKIRGVNLIATRLEQVGERATKGISEIMANESQRIQKLAIRFAPRDTGALEKAIERERVIDDNRRVAYNVFVNPTRTVKVSKKSTRRKRIAKYAKIMEEFLQPYGRGGYKVRRRSREKGAFVGGRYMARASEITKQIIADRVRNAIKREARRGGFRA